MCVCVCVYIYIYSHPQTDFHCITTLQCGYTRRMLEAGIPHQLVNYKVLSNSGSISLFTFYTLPDTRVLNLFEELCIMQAAAIISFARVLNPHGGAYIYVILLQFLELAGIICGSHQQIWEFFSYQNMVRVTFPTCCTFLITIELIQLFSILLCYHQFDCSALKSLY